MKKYFLIIIIGMSGCHSIDRRFIYQDSSNKFYVRLEESEEDGFVDTLYTFYDFITPSQVRQIGFYKNGFRNDKWTYNFENGIVNIKWGHYRDKYLGFETNMFSEADSTKYNDFSTKFLFTTELGEIILNVSINGPFKDSLPQHNYKRLTNNEFAKIGIISTYFETKKMENPPNDIYLSEVEAKDSANNEIRYLKGAFSFIDKGHFIEFSVSSSTKNNNYANILFDAVLTDFVIDGKRLYNPFTKLE